MWKTSVNQPDDSKSGRKITLTRPQENALVASVGFPSNSPAFGVVLRGGHGLVRALTEVGLMRIATA